MTKVISCDHFIFLKKKKKERKHTLACIKKSKYLQSIKPVLILTHYSTCLELWNEIIMNFQLP